MTPTIYRDQVVTIAKTNSEKATEIALKITDQWFDAQAWSSVARYAYRPLACERVVKVIAGMLHGERPPREFFW